MIETCDHCGGALGNTVLYVHKVGTREQYCSKECARKGPTKYTYFVSYWYTDKKPMPTWGYGNVEIIRSAPIVTHADTLGIGQMLEEQGISAGYKVIILNFILLSTEVSE